MEKSLAYTFIYGLLILFVISIMFVIFSHAVVDNFMPTLDGIINNSIQAGYGNQTQATENIEYNAMLIDYWYVFPFIIVFGVIILWLNAGMRKRPGDTQ